MTLYASLADVRAELLAESTVDNLTILHGIRQVSRRIDQRFKANNLFAPTLEARNIALDSSNINSGNRTLMLTSYQGGPSPLLSLAGVSTSGGALVVGATVQTYPAAPAPWYAIQLLGSAWTSWYTAYCSNVWGAQNAAVTGVWGYNADWANAWQEVDALAAAIVSTTATTFTVADVDGANQYGETPRISAGHLLQIDSEWVEVASTDTPTNTVTVRRGVNGSTAATHLIAAPVSVYQVDESIKRAVVRQVSFQYARRGAFEVFKLDGIGVIQFPPDVVHEFNALLNMFANL